MIRVKTHNPNNFPLMDIRDIGDIQGDLKEFESEEKEQAFVKLIKERGVRFAFIVYTDRWDKSWMVAGNGRKKLFLKYDIRNEDLKYEFPVMQVYAKSKKDAARLILEESSKWHKETQEGMKEFMEAYSIDLDFVLESTTMEDFGIEFEGMEGYEGSGGSGEGSSENNYSKKIEAPTYEPKNEKPLAEDLYKEEKTNSLSEEIESLEIPEDEKEFLLKAAQRHRVFNYEKIADYYAHSSKEVQRVMENSALVIIDFDKAIENGYVQLSEETRKQYADEYIETT